MTSNKRRTALITGASSGIGEAIAYNLADRGFNLVLVSENKSELYRVENKIQKYYSIKTNLICINMFKSNAADIIYDTCCRKNIEIEILINCAGIFLNIEKELSELDNIENVINLHVMAPSKLCFLFGRHMVDNKSGYILNISSIASQFLDPSSLTYGPTKNYLRNLSEALHCEWKHEKVIVTCAMPGGISTNFFKANDVFIPPVIRKSLLSAEKCAEISLKAMFKGKARVIPGLQGKLQYYLLKLIVRPFTYDLVKNSYFSMKKKHHDIISN